MLIRVKGSNSFYGRRGSERMKRENESRYRLRAGIAKVALEAKADGKPVCDARGTPLRYANEAAERHSSSTLEQWRKGRSTKTIVSMK